MAGFLEKIEKQTRARDCWQSKIIDVILQSSSGGSMSGRLHFGVVLLLSAVASAPWRSIGIIAILWGLTGSQQLIEMRTNVAEDTLLSQGAPAPVSIPTS